MHPGASAVVATLVAAGTAAALTACGGPHSSAPPPVATTTVSATTTAADACYLVELDLQTLARLPAGSARTTVVGQLTADATTGSAALQQAVQAYVHGTGSPQAVRATC